jgi:hypothetical protein
MPAMELQVDATADLDVTYIPDTAMSEHASQNNLSYIIDFEGPNDPADPFNWSSRYRWSMVILVSILSLIM